MNYTRAIRAIMGSLAAAQEPVDRPPRQRINSTDIAEICREADMNRALDLRIAAEFEMET